MSLSKRKKKILLIAALSIGALLVLTAVFLIVRFREDQKSLSIGTMLSPEEYRGLAYLVERFGEKNPEYRIQLSDGFGESDNIDLYIGAIRTGIGVEESGREILPARRKWATIEVVRRLIEAGHLSQTLVTPIGTDGAPVDTPKYSFLPLLWSPYGLFVNLDVIKGKGYEIPLNWQELVDMVPAISGRPRPIPLALAGPRDQRLDQTRWLLTQLGPQPDTRPTDRGLPSGQAVFDRWIREGLIHPMTTDLEEEDMALMLGDGRLAMVLAPLEFHRHLPRNAVDSIVFLVIPAHAGRAPAALARVVGAQVRANSIKKPVVKDFVDFLAQPANQELWVNRSGSRITFNALHRQARFPNEEGFRITALNRTMRMLRLE